MSAFNQEETEKQRAYANKQPFFISLLKRNIFNSQNSFKYGNYQKSINRLMMGEKQAGHEQFKELNILGRASGSEKDGGSISVLFNQGTRKQAKSQGAFLPCTGRLYNNQHCTIH